MNVIAVDDEPLALRDVVRTLKEVLPACEPCALSSSRAALEHAREKQVDVAFLDIEMPGMNGLLLAKSLKDLQPDIHIVFVTSYDQYAVEAFALHATGYLLKPVHKDDLRRELTFVYDHLSAPNSPLLTVHTFGGFEAVANGAPLMFKRAKSKELLALLVDRRGCSVTMREVCAILWEDEPFSPTQKSYYQTIVSHLRGTLEDAGVSDVLVKSWNNLAVNPTLIECDSYRFLDGDPIAVNAYHGSYLPAYSWAEFSIASTWRHTE